MRSHKIWFDTFFREKRPPYCCWELKDSAGRINIIDTEVVIEAINNSQEEEQARIKDILIKIDFSNGDINKFFRHLAQWIIEEYPAAEVS